MRIIKTILSLCLFASLPIALLSQQFADYHVQRQLDLRGIGGYTTTATTTIGNYIHQVKTYGGKFMHKIVPWNELEPTDSGYDFTNFANDVKKCIDSGLYVTFQIGAGNDAPISGSTHWLVDLGVATFYTTGGIPGPWPDSYNSVYKSRYTALKDTLYKKLKATIAADKLKYILGDFGVFGSTGDPAPFKGNCISPTNCLGIDDDATWHAFEFEMLDSIKKVINKNGMQFTASINTSNDHSLLDSFIIKHPFGIDKAGDLSHDLISLASKLLYTIPKTNKRGEVQGYLFSTPYAHQDGWAAMTFAAAGKCDYINLPSGYFSNVIQGSETEPDPRITGFFNTYAPHNEVTTATKAFIQLADEYDYADSGRFSTTTFHAMIDPSKLSAYNSNLSAINASGYGESYKAFLRLRLIADDLNPTRKAAIDSAGAIYGATDSGSASGNQHFMDFGVGLVKNHELHISQTDPYNTSIGAYRIGGDTAIYGRWARGFDASSHTMTFDIDNRWAGGIQTADIKYTITYLDDNTDVWLLRTAGSLGYTDALFTTNTNTGLWKQATVTVSNVTLGSSADFLLQPITGHDTKFSIIEIEKQ